MDPQRKKIDTEKLYSEIKSLHPELNIDEFMILYDFLISEYQSVTAMIDPQHELEIFLKRANGK